MNTYIKILLVVSGLFFSCAVQSPPPGGATDIKGPYIKRITPQNGTFELNEKQSIEVLFNEMIDPKTVKSSITVFPEINLVINSYNNKIIIKPKDKWPNNQIFKIKLSRYISDFHGNILSNGKTLTFNTSKQMPNGVIRGELFNHDKNNVSQIGLYKINNNNLEFICTTENNSSNEYQFNNINNGEYFIAAVEGGILDLKEDIKIYNYGFSSDKIIISDNTINHDINFSLPAVRKNIKSVDVMNENYAVLQMSDGEYIYIINNDFLSNQLDQNIIYDDFSLDSININIKLNNNIETYKLWKKVYLTNFPEDLTNPYIDSIDYDQGKAIINFSEPVNIIENNEVFTITNDDSTKKVLSYKIVHPMIVEIPIIDHYNSKIHIDNFSINDLSSNKNTLLDTLITINYSENYSDKKIGGNIFGKVIYEGKNEVIVEAIDIKNGDKFRVPIDKYGDFRFYNLDVSKYQLWAYENINFINESYFNGTLEPLKYAARFGYYDDIVEIRARWDMEGLRIRVN